MKYQIGEIVKGTVTGIKPYGAFISIDDKTSGLVHISEVSDDFVKDVKYFVRIGEEVEVKIVDIDEDHNQLRLSLKETRKSSRGNSKYQHRDRLPESIIGFRSLEVNLPIWIEEKKNVKN